MSPVSDRSQDTTHRDIFRIISLYIDNIVCVNVSKASHCGDGLSESDNRFDIGFGIGFGTTRGDSLKLLVPSSRVNCRQHCSTVRVTDVGNSQPEYVVSAKRLSLFVSRLKCVENSYLKSVNNNNS